MAMCSTFAFRKDTLSHLNMQVTLGVAKSEIKFSTQLSSKSFVHFQRCQRREQSLTPSCRNPPFIYCFTHSIYVIYMYYYTALLIWVFSVSYDALT